MSSRAKRSSSKSKKSQPPAAAQPTVSQNVVDLTFAASSSSSKLDIDAFFQQYFIPTEDVATMEGICHFAETFYKIDPMVDIRILVFLWRMIEGQGNHFHFPTATLRTSSSLSSKGRSSSTGSASASSMLPDPSSVSTLQPGHFTKEQFQKGCLKTGIDTEAALRKWLSTLDTGFLEKNDFRNFFKFNRQGTNRFLDKDLVAALIPLILQDRVPTHRTQSFSEFLLSSKDSAYDKIILDQWTSFLDFCTEYDSVSTFDSDGSAWPTLIDDYVAFCLDKSCK